MTDDEVFARFHELRRNNSSRAERQAAWHACELIRMRRLGERARMHPVAPQWQWWNANERGLEGRWTFPYCRSLELGEVERYFPGALDAFDTQCSDIKESRFVYDQWTPNHLRLSVPMVGDGCSTRATVTWLPAMRIWRRYSRAVKVKPYRVLEAQ